MDNSTYQKKRRKRKKLCSKIYNSKYWVMTMMLKSLILPEDNQLALSFSKRQNGIKDVVRMISKLRLISHFIKAHTS
jgi:hypothetical protein